MLITDAVAALLPSQSTLAIHNPQTESSLLASLQIPLDALPVLAVAIDASSATLAILSSLPDAQISICNPAAPTDTLKTLSIQNSTAIISHIALSPSSTLYAASKDGIIFECSDNSTAQWAVGGSIDRIAVGSAPLMVVAGLDVKVLDWDKRLVIKVRSLIFSMSFTL